MNAHASPRRNGRRAVDRCIHFRTAERHNAAGGDLCQRTDIVVRSRGGFYGKITKVGGKTSAGKEADGGAARERVGRHELITGEESAAVGICSGIKIGVGGCKDAQARACNQCRRDLYEIGNVDRVGALYGVGVDAKADLRTRCVGPCNRVILARNGNASARSNRRTAFYIRLRIIVRTGRQLRRRNRNYGGRRAFLYNGLRRAGVVSANGNIAGNREIRSAGYTCGDGLFCGTAPDIRFCNRRRTARQPNAARLFAERVGVCAADCDNGNVARSRFQIDAGNRCRNGIPRRCNGGQAADCQ